MGAAMPLYRFHGELSEGGAHAEESRRLGDDETAMRYARVLLSRYVTVSVWRDGRQLGRVSRDDVGSEL
jgi:hypothetical protein